jgi:hypothetical protein
MQGVQTHIHELEESNEHEHCKIVQFCDSGTGLDQLVMGLGLGLWLWLTMVHRRREVIREESIDALRLDSIDLFVIFGGCN